jgi:hypothetical protein
MREVRVKRGLTWYGVIGWRMVKTWDLKGFKGVNKEIDI